MLRCRLLVHSNLAAARVPDGDGERNSDRPGATGPIDGLPLHGLESSRASACIADPWKSVQAAEEGGSCATPCHMHRAAK